MESDFDDTIMPITSIRSGSEETYSDDVEVLTVQIVNVCLVGNSRGWILVDAGMPGSGKHFVEAAWRRFGEGSRPSAIVLTHGHFDHVGAIIELVEQWNVPVYAHPHELPYLTGESDYPRGNAGAGGGMVTLLSPLFPNHGINLSDHIHPLPEDQSVPGLDDWQWIHTPGHTPGHVSLFRPEDRTLIAGDAFVTVKQESLYNVFVQKQEISGPPKYFTMNWEEARESVAKLQRLNAAIAITGHGIPMSGQQLTTSLERLVSEFDEMALPH